MSDTAPAAIRPLSPGEAAPWVVGRVAGQDSPWSLNAAGGRVVLLCFYGAATRPHARAALDMVMEQRAVFDDADACFFGVSIDPADGDRLGRHLPGIRHYLDGDHAISRAFGACGAPEADKGLAFHPHFLLLDRDLRVVARFRLDAAAEALAATRAEVAAHRQDWAPVLTVPRVFEPELCAALIDRYRHHGNEESGFMREVGGRTRLVHDTAFKRRRDHQIEDEALRRQLALRLTRRLVPMIARAFQFRATRIERYIVARYAAGEGGFFRAHRDNTTAGTAHRRFAVSINLNDAFEGGNLRFPEFGPRTYRAPPGGAVVFSCSLLHEATDVTAGERFAFLPFLYDDAAAAQREANQHRIDLGDAAIV